MMDGLKQLLEIFSIMNCTCNLEQDVADFFANLECIFNALPLSNIVKTPYSSYDLFSNNLRLGVTLKNLSIFQLNHIK